MKVSLDLKAANVGFKGYMPTKDERGYKNYEFLYPHDPNNQNCYVEIFSLDQDKNGNYKIHDVVPNRKGERKTIISPNGTKLDLTRDFGITDNVAFAYHFILEDKHSGFFKPAIDAGDSIDERPSQHNENDTRVYNIVPPNQSEINRGSAMRLVITDSQHVGYVYDKENNLVYDRAVAQKAEHAVKTLVNKFGGTLAGVERGVINGDYKTDIIALPFTDQTNVYWTKNLFQMDPSVGNINNYASMQREMFKRDLHYVSDGAFVNEGLEGIHFSHVLKWGEDSPYFRWFKASGLKDKPFSLGIFSRDTRHISHKPVNMPYIYKQNSDGQISWSTNKKYDPSKPSYIQYFNTKFVTEAERNDTQNLIKTYSKLNTDFVYDSNTHNQTIPPYHVEANPEFYHANILRINEHNSSNPRDGIIKLDGYRAARYISDSENHSVDEGFESGFETWDANPDIAKLNFGFSNADNKTLMNLTPHERKLEIAKIKRANAQVQDYTVDAGKYWTRTTNDIFRLYVAQNIEKIAKLDKSNSSLAADKLRKMSEEGILPKNLASKIQDKEVRNVLAGFYNSSNRVLSDEDKKSQILEGLMNLPLDSIEFGDNLSGVLASPLISKRAGNLSQVGMTRYELFKQGNPHLSDEYKLTYNKMDNLYKTEMLNFAISVLDKVNEKLPDNNKLFDGNEVTKFGQYALPLIVPTIAKYALVKALAPDVKVKINDNNGEIAYDYEKLKEVSLQTIGVRNPGSPEDEALMTLSAIQKGLQNLNSDKEITESILKTLKGTSANSFAIADYIIDKSQAGLDWRIDATKDIADIEALRNFNTDFETTWQNVIDFWKRFAQGILQENPHAYLVAEITDVGDLHKDRAGYTSTKFPKREDIIPKFLRETGITSTADYTYYFYEIAKMFSKSFQTGDPISNDPNELTDHLLRKLMKDGNPFLKAASLPSILYSYSFVANHDKPRPIHCAAMDMGLFYANLNDPNSMFRETAYRMSTNNFFDNVSEYDLKNFDFEKVSPKAVAMGMALRKGFITTLEGLKKENKISDQEFHDSFVAISASLSDMVNGKFRGKRFEPDSFGVKPIDINIDMVIKQAREKHGLKLSSANLKVLSNNTFKNVVDPAIPKLLAMMKYLVALPGKPTLFDGDDMGSTGYDSETKNMYLQCRNKVHEEWVADEKSTNYKKFIAEHKKNFDKVMELRNKPELEPLNNGAPFVLPKQEAMVQWNEGEKYNIPAILRQSTNGKITISLLNTVDQNRNNGRFPYDNENTYEPQHMVLDSIKLNFESQGPGNDVMMNGEQGIGISGLKNNMMFRDANNPDDIYYVNEHNGKYFLKHGSGDGRIYLNDTTMILYHDPKDDKKQPTFSGRYYTQTPQFAANAYDCTQPECGKKLSLCAR